MSQGKLAEFGSYQKALALFGHVVEESTHWLDEFRCRRLVGQQLASADLVCANMEEGYGRKSNKELLYYW